MDKSNTRFHPPIGYSEQDRCCGVCGDPLRDHVAWAQSHNFTAVDKFVGPWKPSAGGIKVRSFVDYRKRNGMNYG